MSGKNRAVAMLAAGALTLTLAACSSDSKGEGDTDLADKQNGAVESFSVGDQFKATEPLSLSILFSDHPNYPLSKDWLLWSEITSRTNVTLDPTIVPMSDYEQKRSLLIGAGDAPLIIPKTYPGQETPFVSSGAVLPVSDYLDLMPNLSDKIEKWELGPDLDTLRQEDGKFYVLPGVHEEVWQDYTVAFRTDILDELGLEAPATWDDMHDVLASMKAAYPDVTPLSDRFEGNSLLNVAAPTFGTSAGWGFNTASWDADAESFVYTGATDEYKAMIEYFQGLVSDGLMDTESFTQDDDSAIQKLATGKSFAISTNAQSIVNDYRPALEGTPTATIAKIPVPSGPSGNLIAGSRLENGLMISSAAAERDDFVAIMQFVDWLWYSDEGQEFVKWGVEDTTFTRGADGKRVLAEDIDFVGLNPGASKHLQKDFGFSTGVFAYGGTTDLLQSTFSEEELAFQSTMDSKDTVPLAPPFPFDELEREQATLWETPLKDYTNQMTLQFILGQRDMSDWDKYVSELEAKGMTSYIDLVNTAHERFVKNNA